MNFDVNMNAKLAKNAGLGSPVRMKVVRARRITVNKRAELLTSSPTIKSGDSKRNAHASMN